jgi:predicted DNA-binding antitoxin AbrB/MazE fold protein
MTQTLEAVFDGSVLHPVEPLSLRPNTRVRITVELEPQTEPPPRSFLQTARSLKLDGPTDWSDRIEDYLYEKQDDERQ